MKTIDTSKVQMIAAQVLNGNIQCTEEFIRSNIIIAGCNTSVEASFWVNPIESKITCNVSVELFAVTKDKVSLPVQGSYTLEFIFLVNNIEEYIIEQSINGIVVDPSIAFTLVSISYSTARGIIISRTEGTILKGVILPIIDPKKLLIKQMENKPISISA